MRRFFVLLLLSTCFLSACAGILGRRDAEFETAGRLVREKRFSDAVATYAKIARESPASERGANALFACATVRTLYDNPQKDYALALQGFDEFLRLYPNHDRALDAQSWRSVLKMLLELKKENEQLAASIEQLKRLDVRQEERRLK